MTKGFTRGVCFNSKQAIKAAIEFGRVAFPVQRQFVYQGRSLKHASERESLILQLIHCRIKFVGGPTQGL